MKFLLQSGAGMRSLARAVVRAAPGTTVILSPKDFKNEEQLVDHATTLSNAGGRILCDPQLYLQAIGRDAARLPPCSYWKKREDPYALTESVLELNRKIGSDAVILPTPYLSVVDEKSMDCVRAIARGAVGLKESTYLTVCLAAEFFRSERQYNRLFKFLERIDVSGIYLLPEHVDDDYFTDDPVWLHRLFELCADIKMAGKKVLVGYANHQLLPLACSAVDGVAVGKNRFTRIFWMDSFKKKEEGDVGFSHPKPSYYCPQALTEFSLKYMDLAREESVLELMRPNNVSVSDNVDGMLRSQSPVSSGYTLLDGYLHYFSMFSEQCKLVSLGKTFSNRLSCQVDMLNEAEKFLLCLHKHHIRGLLKDFSKYIGIAKSALQAFEESRGTNLSLMSHLFGNC